MEWNGYEPYVPPHPGLLGELPRRAASESFRHFLSSRDARVGQLRTLLAANGGHLGSDDDSVQQLNDWFRSNVERNPDSPDRLHNSWYAVVHDIGVFLGDLLIERCPALSWKMFIWGKRDIAYQRPVVMGFPDLPNSKYNFDPADVIATYGHRIIRGLQVEDDLFVALVRRS